ncbi:hypothetical protein B0681_09910 [Moraxella porci DSM 25326]|uniref:Trimeric autotransporter adhesin YadA-like C-terminal membrane anchor domain-containing protein n=1 Tax=Moraxella porci DSM 25326 TaxID=573983 RepID=A0A1T0CLD5_9GAMM|nr:YadA-like family protein [Moraxella porci]OOS23162.1 hypothetical protein B0681_09910 [Moraxella porci DSM 25326]
MAEGGRNISIGEAAGVGTADNWNIYNVNIGSEAGQNSKKDYSVAVGYRAGALTDAQQLVQEGVVDGGRHPSVLIGKQAGEGTVAYGTVAIGQDAGKNISDTRSVKNIAIGSGAGEAVSSNDGRNAKFGGFGAGANTMIGAGAGRSLSGDGNVAIGNLTGSGTTGDNNFFGGHLAGANGSSDRSIIIGSHAGEEITSDRSVFIGNYAHSEKKGNVVTGIAIGNSTLAGKNTDGSTTYNSIAIGNSAAATNDNTIALGGSASASGLRSTAIGSGAESSGEQAIAIGRGAVASGEQSISIGTGNTVTGANSGAFGDPTTISGTGSYSVGNNNTIATNDTFVMGSSVTKTADNSVFLGKEAAYTAKGASTDGIGAVTEPVTVGGTLTYGDFAGKTSVGVVSVGDVNKERRIQNVAAGLISATSTDAINGSQLYATNVKLGNVAKTVVENFGGNATLNADGSITYTDIGNTGKNTIHEAIAAATTKVEAGENVEVTKTDNADGSTTYTVATAKALNVDSVTAGDTVINNDGLTVGDITVTGDTITVNGNTVNNINEAINQTAEQAFKPLTFTGDSGSTNRKLGETFAIVAGNATDTSTKNLKTTVTDGQVEISMTESPEFKSITATESVVIGGVNGDSTTLTSTTDGLDVGGDKITNVAAGEADTDAVNVSQLKKAQAAATTKVEAGENVEVTKTDNADGSTTYTVATAKALNVDSVTAGDTVLNKDGVTVGDNVSLNKDGLVIADGPSVTVDGINAGNTVITNVATGKADTDAVNLKQMNDAIANINTSIAASKEEVKSDDRSVTVTVSQNANNANVYDLSVNTDGVTLTKDEATGAIKVNTTTLVDADGDGRVDAPSTADSDKLVNAGDIVKIVNNSGFTLTAQGKNGSLVTSGATVDMNNTDGNIVIEKSSGDNNVTYNLAKDLKLDSVTTGDTVVNNDGITISNGNTNGQSVSITKDGLNNGGNRITNVAPGAISAGSSDVINGDQLYRLTKDMDQRFGDTYNRIDELNANRKAGSASAMAAAGLPQAYREGQSGIVAALGQYEGETGVAIGFTSISDNGKWLFRGAYATNTQKENSANLGLGYFW